MEALYSSLCYFFHFPPPNELFFLSLTLMLCYINMFSTFDLFSLNCIALIFKHINNLPDLWFRFQVRYGQHWAPVHPDEPLEGVFSEILLNQGETFIHLNGRAGWIIDCLEFISNRRTYPVAGVPDVTYTKYVPLNGLLYFSGTAGEHMGIRVTSLTAHRNTCETASS